MGYPIGRFGFTLSAVMIRKKNKVRAELYISGEKAKGFFTSLKEQREEIEGELEYHLEKDPGGAAAARRRVNRMI